MNETAKEQVEAALEKYSSIIIERTVRLCMAECEEVAKLYRFSSDLNAKSISLGASYAREKISKKLLGETI